MGYDYYFINETNKEVVSSKVVSDGFEDSLELMEWLKDSINCRIMIVGQDEKIIEDYISGKALLDFKDVDLRKKYENH